MARPVKCPFCEQTFYREQEPGYQTLGGRYYHKECFKKKQEEEKYKQDIHSFCKEKYGASYSKMKIDRSIKTYLEEGKSLSGIYRTVVYHFTHGGDPEKSNGGIAFVSWMYSEAENYYRRQYEIEQKQAAALARVVEQAETTETQTYHIKPTPLMKPRRVNLFDIQ